MKGMNFMYSSMRMTLVRRRVLFKRAFPEAQHLYTEEVFREVETTPIACWLHIAKAHFNVKDEFYG